MIRAGISSILQHLAEIDVREGRSHELSGMEWQGLHLADVEDRCIFIVTYRRRVRERKMRKTVSITMSSGWKKVDNVALTRR